MNRYALQLFLIIVMAMMSTASGEEKVKIIVYEEFSKLGDPYADGDDKADFDLKKIEELIVSDQYLALFFQGVFEEEIKEKGLTHPFIGKPIYLEIQVGDKKNDKLIQLNLGYKGGFYKIVRDPKSGKFLSFHPSNNKFFTLMMQEYLVSRIKGLTK